MTIREEFLEKGRKPKVGNLIVRKYDDKGDQVRCVGIIVKILRHNKDTSLRTNPEFVWRVIGGINIPQVAGESYVYDFISYSSRYFYLY